MPCTGGTSSTGLDGSPGDVPSSTNVLGRVSGRVLSHVDERCIAFDDRCQSGLGRMDGVRFVSDTGLRGGTAVDPAATAAAPTPELGLDVAVLVPSPRSPVLRAPCTETESESSHAGARGSAECEEDEDIGSIGAGSLPNVTSVPTSGSCDTNEAGRRDDAVSDDGFRLGAGALLGPAAGLVVG